MRVSPALERLMRPYAFSVWILIALSAASLGYAGIARVRISSAYHFALSFGSRSRVS